MTDTLEALYELPATMTALRFARAGNPSDVLTVAIVPTPRAGRGDVLVEVHAAGINPSDVRNVAGAFPQTLPPRTPGRDFAGRVVEGTAAWLGAEVLGTAGELGFVRDGTHAEYVLVPTGCLVRKPVSLSMPAAASLGVPYVTAWEGLRRARFGAGDRVLVVGGAGAVGGAVARLARWGGAAMVIASTRRPVGADDPLRRHAHRVVDVTGEDLAVATREHTGGRGVDVVFNTVGGGTFAPGLLALARGGRLVVIAAPASETEARFDLRDFYRRELEFIGIDSLRIADADAARALGRVVAGLEGGAFDAPASDAVDLSDAVASYEDVARGVSRRVLVMPRGSRA